MLVLCDFDGTITEVDVTDLIWNDRISATERLRMTQEVEAGRWNMLSYIAHGYAFVQEPPDQLLDQLVREVRLRKGWLRFVEAVAASLVSLHIVSNGLSFYIRRFLPESIAVTCLVARFDGVYDIQLPAGCVLLPGEDFKVNRVRALLSRYPGQPSVYVGDGRADFAPALLCDQVFAVRGSRLAALRKAQGLATTEFESFDAVTNLVLAEGALQAPGRSRAAR